MVDLRRHCNRDRNNHDIDQSEQLDWRVRVAGYKFEESENQLFPPVLSSPVHPGADQLFSVSAKLFPDHCQHCHQVRTRCSRKNRHGVFDWRACNIFRKYNPDKISTSRSIPASSSHKKVALASLDLREY